MQIMMLFIREHLPIVFFEVFVVMFILLLYWLDGFRDMNTAIYSMLITLVLTGTFLIVRYVIRKQYYKKITNVPQKMEDALQSTGKSPEHVQSEEYIHELYRIYQLEAQELYAAQNRHLQFMNQWVHQMKTPLSVLELMLQDDEPLDKKGVQEEVERLKHGLEMVLMNARLDTFEEDMHIEKVDLQQLVMSVVNQHKRLFITHRVFPSVTLPENLMVTTDSKWMKFIIGQFITNAVKYTFDSGKKVYITADVTADTVSLSVRDEGIGIPPTDLKRVTKAFFTGENGRKSGESTGMGLYLADEICQKLGHALTISSTVDVGTTVTVTFNLS
ncbi:sensor histidine kinase [Kurthia massiliensis]|uniref:sensor histidine kinase n=1 Tax=Kurthia massiliensis TaxID=1033739 RepID=UPI0002894078|nr:sensor histidine kinase [Kurthia massiliensis]